MNDESMTYNEAYGYVYESRDNYVSSLKSGEIFRAVQGVEETHIQKLEMDLSLPFPRQLIFKDIEWEAFSAAAPFQKGGTPLRQDLEIYNR